jgi:hypothetical protein
MSNGGEMVEVQGTRVPVLGSGTWLIAGHDAREAVRDVLRAEIDALPKDIRTADLPWAPDRNA